MRNASSPIEEDQRLKKKGVGGRDPFGLFFILNRGKNISHVLFILYRLLNDSLKNPQKDIKYFIHLVHPLCI